MHPKFLSRSVVARCTNRDLNRRDGRRALLAALPGLAAATALGCGFSWLPSRAHAAADFKRPVRIVVPFGAGGIADLTARAVAQGMEADLGVSVIVENKPGAGGVVAATQVAKAAADGHTLLLMSNGNAVSAALFKSLPFDTMKDFAPISTLGAFGIAIIVDAGSRFASLPALIAEARANPGKLNIGTIAIGSTQNLAAELFKTSAGIDAQIVPFNGTPALITAVRAGHVDLGFEIVGPVVPQVGGGALRALAVTSMKRARTLPDVPTVIESGIANYEVTSWNALGAPARTPAPIVARLGQSISSALASPPVLERFAQLGVEALSGTPAELRKRLEDEIRRWNAVIDRAAIERK